MALLEIFNFLHFLGLAFGLGGATIATIIMAKAGKDKDIAKAAGKIMPSIVKLIWLGMLLLIVSGIFITLLVTWPLNRNLLIVKHVLVAWIIVIGVIMGFMMKKAHKIENKNLLPSLRKRMKILSSINLILWYLVTLLSAFV